MAHKVKDLGLGKTQKKTKSIDLRKNEPLTQEPKKELEPISSMRFFNKKKNPKRFDNKKKN